MCILAATFQGSLSLLASPEAAAARTATSTVATATSATSGAKTASFLPLDNPDTGHATELAVRISSVGEPILAQKADITVTAEVKNTSAQPLRLEHLSLYAERSTADTREAILDFMGGASASLGLLAEEEPKQDLAPGQTASFTLRLDRKFVSWGEGAQWGPRGIQVTAEAGGISAMDRSMLIIGPDHELEKVPAGIVLPLTVRPENIANLPSVSETVQQEVIANSRNGGKSPAKGEKPETPAPQSPETQSAETGANGTGTEGTNGTENQPGAPADANNDAGASGNGTGPAARNDAGAPGGNEGSGANGNSGGNGTPGTNGTASPGQEAGSNGTEGAGKDAARGAANGERGRLATDAQLSALAFLDRPGVTVALDPLLRSDVRFTQALQDMVGRGSLDFVYLPAGDADVAAFAHSPSGQNLLGEAVARAINLATEQEGAGTAGATGTAGTAETPAAETPTGPEAPTASDTQNATETPSAPAGPPTPLGLVDYGADAASVATAASAGLGPLLVHSGDITTTSRTMPGAPISVVTGEDQTVPALMVDDAISHALAGRLYSYDAAGDAAENGANGTAETAAGGTETAAGGADESDAGGAESGESGAEAGAGGEGGAENNAPAGVGELDEVDSRQVTLALSAQSYLEKPDSSRSQLLAVDRAWLDAGAGYANAETVRKNADALLTAPWITASSPAQLNAATERTTANMAEKNIAAGEANPRELRSAAESMQDISSVARITSTPSMITNPSWDRAMLSAGASLRARPDVRADLVAGLEETANWLQDAVSIQASSTINVISETTELPVHVRNDLPMPIGVVVRLSAPDYRIVPKEEVAATIPAASTTTVSVPIRASGSGNIVLSAVVTDPPGQVTSAVQTIRVRVRAGWETAGTTIAAIIFGLVLITGLVRSVHRGRRSRAVAPGEHMQNVKQDRQRRRKARAKHAGKHGEKGAEAAATAEAGARWPGPGCSNTAGSVAESGKDPDSESRQSRE
ncbi:hypothetical protein ACU19_08190 [Actinobaculum suis]|uniref:DUF6049 family protein n=1 Tax=Actinobaculum suis TaxID=1657 RepID=UPI00066FD5FB|nr:DUF6049 family protein [Actinobaculum suis]KMY22770.1 hypothetical protein ACU19_08190 [Actinobaculum suis]